MTLRTLLLWGVIASLLAGCSGGGAGAVSSLAGSSITPVGSGSTSSGGPPTIPASKAATVNVSFVVSEPQMQSNKRQVKFVAPSANVVQYTATVNGAVGPPYGADETNVDVLLSDSQLCTASTNTGLGVTETCELAMLPGTYTGIQVNLLYCSSTSSYPPTGCTPVAESTTSGPFSLALPGSTANVSLQVEPVIGSGSGPAGPALSLVAGSPTLLFTDGSTNVITVYANELDAVGDIISTYYGPMCNLGVGPNCTATTGWPTLDFTNVNSSAGVGVNSTNPNTFTPLTGTTFTIGGPPAAQAGSIELIEYDGVSANSQDLKIQLNDQVGSPPYTANGNVLDFPFITLSGTANGTPLATTTAGGYGTSGNPVHLGSTAGTLTIVATEKTTNDSAGYGVPDAASTGGYLNGLGFVTYSTCASSVISSYVADSGGAGSGIGLYPISPENPTTSSGLTYTLTTTGSTSGEPNPCEYVIQSQANPNLSMMIYLASP